MKINSIILLVLILLSSEIKFIFSIYNKKNSELSNLIRLS